MTCQIAVLYTQIFAAVVSKCSDSGWREKKELRMLVVAMLHYLQLNVKQ